MGITILNETSRLTPNYGWLIALIMIGFFAALAGVCCATLAETISGRWIASIAGVLGAIMLIVGIVTIESHQQPIYWIITNGETTVEKLHEDYEIIGYEGDIIKVVERESIE